MLINQHVEKIFMQYSFIKLVQLVPIEQRSTEQIPTVRKLDNDCSEEVDDPTSTN